MSKYGFCLLDTSGFEGSATPTIFLNLRTDTFLNQRYRFGIRVTAQKE